ncbi:MAG: hypothetical protein R3A46_03540 [Thermomicrobiales bacterium]
MASQSGLHPGVRETFDVRHLQLSQFAWLGAGVTGSFLVPFLFSSLLDLQHDLYYLIYFALAGGFLGAYVRWNDVDLPQFLRANIWPSILVGAPIALFLIFNVLSRDSTPHPDGAYFAFEIGWRGLLYGIVDGLLLTAFPALVAFRLVGGALKGMRDRLRFAGLVLIFTIVITGTYHLGYDQFREDGIAQPELGNVIISIPAMATGNPVGSIVAHSAMHVTAVAYSYETDVFLPPQTDSN